MESVSSDVSRLLAGAPQKLPLTEAELRPAVDACGLRVGDAALLFPDAREPVGALAGLLLRSGCWEESHKVAQDIESAVGSYWHGILHRMEPDPANARYWFRRVGSHAIFPELLQQASEILKVGGPKHWSVKNIWDPVLFIDWCDEARVAHGQAETAATEIQMAEWQLLFNWCCGPQAG